MDTGKAPLINNVSDMYSFHGEMRVILEGLYGSHHTLPPHRQCHCPMHLTSLLGEEREADLRCG